MKKLNFIITAVLVLAFASAWTLRPAFNRVKSVVITARGASVIPVMFTTGEENNASQSRVLEGLAGAGYSHLQILNDTKYPLSLVSSESQTPPDTDVRQKLYVLSSGAASFDDVSIFDNLYIMSEAGGSVYDGTVRISVW